MNYYTICNKKLKVKCIEYNFYVSCLCIGFCTWLWIRYIFKFNYKWSLGEIIAFLGEIFMNGNRICITKNGELFMRTKSCIFNWMHFLFLIIVCIWITHSRYYEKEMAVYRIEAWQHSDFFRCTITNRMNSSTFQNYIYDFILQH